MWLSPSPDVSNLIISPSTLIEKVIIVGDVHGCLQELKDLLAKCDYNPLNSIVILVGDLVNKGPFSAEVIQFVRSQQFYCVRGNHDESALSHALGTSKTKKTELYDYLDSLTR